MSESALLLLQAAADTAGAYREFPVFGSRTAVWIAAEIHLMFGAFVLGVPMFAVVAEGIGIFGKSAAPVLAGAEGKGSRGDERYDRLSKEFTRLLLIAYSATVGYEPLLGALVLAWAWLTDDLMGRRGLGGWRLAALGVISGAGTLIKPICLLLPGLSLLVWLMRRQGAAALARAAAAAVLMMLIVAPWTLRNWRALGHPVLVSTNGGVVLYSANNPVSRGIAARMKPSPDGEPLWPGREALYEEVMRERGLIKDPPTGSGDKR